MNLGLVCITHDETVRFRTLTRTRYLKLSPVEQRQTLRDLYTGNLKSFDKALDFCVREDIRLYRVTSALFPFSDEPLGRDVLLEMSDQLALIGKWAERLHLRIVVHPDQYVVLSSDSPEVIANSIKVMQRHALAFDLMRLPQNPWAAMILHGGKSDRAARLIDTIGRLPDNIRRRLVLENDEYAYKAQQIYEVCVAAKVPMVFDAHHHLVAEKLCDYEHPSVSHFTELAATTWPCRDWQLVHLSNGASGMCDPAHHDLITHWPSAFDHVPWVEIEAKHKDRAIKLLRAKLSRPGR